MFKNKNFRIGILSGVIASLLILIFIQPILLFVWKNIQNAGPVLFNNYVDYLYGSASLGERNWTGAELYIYANFFGLLVLYTMILKMNRRTKKLIAYNDKDDERTIEEKKQELLEKRKSLQEKVDKFKKNSKKFFILLYSASALMTVLILHNIFKTFIDIQLNTTFKQRMMVISPQLSEQQEEEFMAKWAMMKSKLDYQAINNEIEKIASKNNIQLPNALL